MSSTECSGIDSGRASRARYAVKAKEVVKYVAPNAALGIAAGPIPGIAFGVGRVLASKAAKSLNERVAAQSAIRCTITAVRVAGLHERTKKRKISPFVTAQLHGAPSVGGKASCPLPLHATAASALPLPRHHRPSCRRWVAHKAAAHLHIALLRAGGVQAASQPGPHLHISGGQAHHVARHQGGQPRRGGGGDTGGQGAG